MAANEINLLNPDLRWTASDANTKLIFHDNYLRSEPGRDGSKTVNSVPLGRSTKDYDMLLIKIRSTKSGLAELFWAPRRDQFSIFRNYPFYVDKDYKSNLINLAAYNRDGSRLNHFLLMGNGTFEISEMKLIKSGLGEKAVAAWQEFFGPLSRTSDGMEFLIIRSPRVFGSTFVYLINFLLIIFLFLALIFRNKKDLSRVFLLTLLFFWGAAELNSLRNNFLAIRRDSGYLGKTLEEKRAMMNGGDFYSFLKFAERALPIQASFDVATYGPYYNYRAAYYLYPRIYENGAAFLLVYDAPFDRKAFPHYKLWKTFRPGAYIYKS